MITADSSLVDVQANNAAMYRETNDRDYGPLDMFTRVHRHTTLATKPIRQSSLLDANLQQAFLEEKKDAIQYQLCMALSWTLAMFNRLHLDLDAEMWARFPGVCPYCVVAPCDCRRSRRKERQDLAGVFRREKPVTLRDWQAMFRAIYPPVLLVSTLHLAEEMGEVHIVLNAHMSTHRDGVFGKVQEELVDVVTNIFAVASCLGIDLAAAMAEYFGNACPGCKSSPCACGFVAEV